MVKKKEKKKEGDKPKRPITAYSLYLNQRRPIIIQEHPELKEKEINSLLRKEWKALSLEQKKPYIDFKEKDRLRYIWETVQYNKKRKRRKRKKKE